MSYHNQVTFRCDSCDKNFIIDEEIMELPPGWLGLQLIVADTEGCIPEHEREKYSHFCSQECLIENVAGDETRRRLCTPDESGQPVEDGEEEEEEDL